MNNALKGHIGTLIGSPIDRISPLSGGDISAAFCLHTKLERFFCKINQQDSAYAMFLAEKKGLEAIAKTGTIKAPKIYFHGKFQGESFLIMEYIESKRPTSRDMELLGHQLAEMHKIPIGIHFGWGNDNFIGSLPQSNTEHSDWTSFYVNERLQPQLLMAQTQRFLHSTEIPRHEKMSMVCQDLFGTVTPSLLHGDLWGGNFLISTAGVPYLIDPATYYGHNEVDMTMTRLFGGFDPFFYKAYSEHFPEESQQNKRNDLYQLYYLLVHLNLFGKSYYAPVKNLLKTYFENN